jgi:hypothetical protein
VLAFLGTAAWLIDTGHSLAGTFLGTVDLVSLAGVFVFGVRAKAEREPEALPKAEIGEIEVAQTG